MSYNPDIHHRRSIRLKDYDYSSEGAYFITICVKDREHLFGDIVGYKMNLNQNGIIVKNEWEKTPEIRKEIIIDEFIIMPNHMHGIIFIQNIIPQEEGELRFAPTGNNYTKSKFHSPVNTIGSMVRGFKLATTKQINLLRNSPGLPLWQRNYHEHIIRSEKSLEAIRKYISENPLKWETDSENPKNHDVPSRKK